MQYFGEILSIGVAVSWTATALFSEVASKRLGSLQLNVIRMILSLLMLGATLWFFTGVPYPLYADGKAWFWLSLSGFVGYVLGDYCLFNSYVLIGSRFGQLFMTLAPIAAAISGWIILKEHLSLQVLAGMLITLTGIGMSILSRGTTHRIGLKLPLKGVLFGIGAGIGQGVGLVLSKVGMNYYELSVPANMTTVSNLLPFASTLIRAITGMIGFLVVMWLRKQFFTMPVAIRDRRGMKAALGATVFGPFIGVSISLMAVQYTEAGIASTLMALTPIFILWPSHFIFKQKITVREVIGAIISVVGVSLFFI
ncbi:DMT family transporter [uncultured Bacteroides sp.]|uniref:DMT family transporter n=1 Tax=uncultured Bacteroides sp. TaxID=162156 RepID=UPI002AA7B7A4|nr:DMT family transporter [uncultured Bacteroides sp.]